MLLWLLSVAMSAAAPSTADRPTDLSPPEQDVVDILIEIRKTQPELGVKKLQAAILEKNPHWRLSEKVRKPLTLSPNLSSGGHVADGLLERRPVLYIYLMY